MNSALRSNVYPVRTFLGPAAKLVETRSRSPSVRGDKPPQQEHLLEPERPASAAPTYPARTTAWLAVRRLAAAAALGAMLLAAPALGAGADAPSPAAVALAKSKCAQCHAVPVPGSRRNGWGQASMNMHVRRVALPPAEWALVREYLGVPTEIR